MDTDGEPSALTAKKSFGIVIILDALGMKSRSLSDVDEFLKLQHLLVSELPFRVGPYKGLFEHRKTQRAAGHEIPTLPPNFQPMRVATIGDTFICTYEIQEHTGYDVLFPFYYCEEWCPLMMTRALMKGFFLRGAMAVGEYLLGAEGTNTVLGPAVTDAANWYEQADWIGIAVTPSSGFYLDHIYVAKGQPKDVFYNQRYVKYPVPLHGRLPLPLWVVNWPAYFVMHECEYSMPQIVASFFAGKPMPRGSESKYLNTFAFVEQLWERVPWRNEEVGSHIAKPVSHYFPPE